MLGKSVLCLIFIYGFVEADVCTKCLQTQIHHMSTADCFNRELREIPQCFKSNIEVLEMSYNRIRKISASDLKKYTNLKILYLSDNMITSIDEEALEDKTSLETLDISYNAFTKIPPVVFHLPSLKKLYMSQNQNINIAHDMENSKPITSPLMYLNIAYNDLNELPDLGIIPTLFYYNITGNINVKMNTSKFAGICKLKMLYNNNSVALFDDPCECWSLQTWLVKRHVEFNSFNCIPSDCSSQILFEDLEVFEECNRIYDDMEKKEKLLKIGLSVGIFGIILILLILIVYIIRKRRQKLKLVREKSKMVTEGLL